MTLRAAAEDLLPTAVDDRPDQSERQQADRSSASEILAVLAVERARKACGVGRRRIALLATGAAVPLARPALTSLAILLTVWTWNQFLLSIVLVDDPTKRTMAGALGAFQGQWGADIPLLSAGSLLILTPTLIVFLIFQRHFVAALLQGSIKG